MFCFPNDRLTDTTSLKSKTVKNLITTRVINRSGIIFDFTILDYAILETYAWRTPSANSISTLPSTLVLFASYDVFCEICEYQIVGIPEAGCFVEGFVFVLCEELPIRI